MVKLIIIFFCLRNIKKDCGKNALSENCYEKCMGIVDKLNAFPLENSNLLSEKALTRFKLIFKFYCWKSESEWKNKHQEIALALLHRAKDLLIKIPEEVKLQTIFCI